MRAWGHDKWQKAITALAVVPVYLLATWLSLLLVIPSSGVTLVWLPAGVAFGVLWRLGLRYWPLVAVADLSAQALIGNPPGFLPFTAATNTLGSLLAVHLARRWSAAGPGTYSVRTAAVLSASGFVLGLASAPLGVLGLVLNGMLPAGGVPAGLVAWIVADAFGLLLVAPAVILALTALSHEHQLGRRRSRRGERVIWLLAVTLAVALVFAAGAEIGERYPMSLTAIPLALLLWSAVRFPPLFTAVATLSGGLLLAFVLVGGVGPTSAPQTTLQAAAVLIFLSVLVATPLMLTAYSAERQLALDALAAANSDLESRVAERTAELQRVLDDLRSAQDSLVRQETLASLGGLVAGVAHELNTPIGVAVTSASSGLEAVRSLRAAMTSQPRRSTLEAGLRDFEEGFALALSSAQRAASLIGTFRQVAADHRDQVRRRCELGQVVQDALVALQPLFDQRLDVRLEAQPCSVDTYPGALVAVLQQLIGNAAQHAYPDGRGPLWIRLGPRRDGGAQIEVTDEGVGMDAELAGRAFHPFVTTRRGRGGTGLGLHVVHNVVSGLLGGSVALQTAPGQGCRVRIELPERAPDALGDPEPTSPPRSP